MPNENNFEDLIDSMLNMLDERFDHSDEDGFKVAQVPAGKLISFFENITVRSPIWSCEIDLEGESRKLSLLNNEGNKILTLTQNGYLGIKQENPAYMLDVEGTIASRGRIGKKGTETIHANGHWQDITEELSGCNAFEIMAGVGKSSSGKYALMHAFALKTFNARGRIVYHQAHYGSRCNRLKLRWEDISEDKYVLQLKTGCPYDKPKKQNGDGVSKKKTKTDVGVYVQYYKTVLWFDESMQYCEKSEKGNVQ